MNTNSEKNSELCNDSTNNEPVAKKSRLPESVYIERMIEIVYYDVKHHGKTIYTFDKLAKKVNESFKNDFFYSVPYIDTGKDYIREYVRKKRKELEEEYKRLNIDHGYDGKVNNSYDELIDFCKKDYIINYIIKSGFFESFDSCECCTTYYPYAVLFVKKNSENLISDFLLENLDEYIKGTIIGNRCLQVYFHDYKCRTEFYNTFFEIVNTDYSDDIDDSDDKIEEKENI